MLHYLLFYFCRRVQKIVGELFGLDLDDITRGEFLEDRFMVNNLLSESKFYIL